jgi:hypothetical protein
MDNISFKHTIEDELFKALHSFPNRFFMGCGCPTIKHVPELDRWCGKCKSLINYLKKYPDLIMCDFCDDSKDSMCHICINTIENRADEQGLDLCCLWKTQCVEDKPCNAGNLCKDCSKYRTPGKWVNWFGIHTFNQMTEMTLSCSSQRKKVNLTQCSICCDLFPSTRQKQHDWYLIGENKKYDIVLCPKHKHFDIDEVKKFFFNPPTLVIKSPYNTETVLNKLHSVLTVPTVLLELIVQYIFY